MHRLICAPSPPDRQLRIAGKSWKCPLVERACRALFPTVAGSVATFGDARIGGVAIRTLDSVGVADVLNVVGVERYSE